MKVRELIELLQGFDPEKYVLISNDGGMPSEVCDVWDYDEDSVEIY